MEVFSTHTAMETMLLSTSRVAKGTALAIVGWPSRTGTLGSHCGLIGVNLVCVEDSLLSLASREVHMSSNDESLKPCLKL